MIDTPDVTPDKQIEGSTDSLTKFFLDSYNLIDSNVSLIKSALLFLLLHFAF